MPSDRSTGFSSAFDEMLERSRRELDALSGGSDAPALSPTPRTASQTAPAPRSPAERALDKKLGADWRYEILERTREGGDLVVRCRVTAPARGVSRTWYGSAPVSGAGRGASNFGRGASVMGGKAGNVSFTLGAGTGTGAGVGANNSARNEREAERQAVESALAACARLL